MRIVSGRHRGRPVHAPPGADIRPTADRVREALYNILEHRGWGEGGLSPVVGARVLDAFCGTGALGIEALSRGAAHATFMDDRPSALAACRDNLRRFGETADTAEVLQGDCLNPVRPHMACSLVLLDPPYGRNLAAAALDALAARGWIAAGALCVAETGSKEELVPPQGFEVLDDRRYGAARLRFLRRQPADG